MTPGKVWICPGGNRSWGWFSRRPVTGTVVLMEGKRMEKGDVDRELTIVPFSK